MLILKYKIKSNFAETGYLYEYDYSSFVGDEYLYSGLKNHFNEFCYTRYNFNEYDLESVIIIQEDNYKDIEYIQNVLGEDWQTKGEFQERLQELFYKYTEYLASPVLLNNIIDLFKEEKNIKNIQDHILAKCCRIVNELYGKIDKNDLDKLDKFHNEIEYLICQF